MTTKPVMSILTCKSALDNITGKLTTGSTMKIYTGSQPASTTASEVGTLLGTLTFSSTAFPASTSLTTNGIATATANAIASETNAPSSGTAGHFILLDGSSVRQFQGNAGTSATDLILNTTTITAGDTIACTSFLMTLPCGDGVS